jgi:formylglycine-generating enzyme required for sulfatase activity
MVLGLLLLAAAAERGRSQEGARHVGDEIAGRDGAPMVFIPPGEFLYGDDQKQVSLPAFYLDKYEVSTRLYAAFLDATDRPKPDDWSRQVTNSDRPVVQVSWYDAEAYCRHYGKYLPTEQEWEKAARGTDGRAYPWGDDAPTDAHALFDREWWGYGLLAAVNSYALGQSPFGLYQMAGNVWEWTGSDYDGDSKVLRGGSWGHAREGMRTTHRFHRPPSYRNYFMGFRCAKAP